MLKKIGLSPGKKLLVFFIAAIALTLPLPYVYNSIAIILFVVYSMLAAKKEEIVLSPALLLPAALFVLMTLSLVWSIDSHSTIKALSREASLLFIPLAFCLCRPLTAQSSRNVMNAYSLGMCGYAMFFLIRAVVRYINGGGSEVFFYHELATGPINAIYLSALISPALLWFLVKTKKTFWSYVMFVFMLLFLFLLSSKTIIIINVLLIAAYFVFFSSLTVKAKLGSVLLFILFVGVVGYTGKINDRIVHEFRPNIAKGTAEENGPHNVTIFQAWTQPVFTQNDYFNGTAFRVYQIRIFKEMLAEDAIFFTGYGLNASMKKINAKGIEHGVYQTSEENVGYNKMNFHNQYIESFADLGIFGLVLIILILAVNLKNALKNKDFAHIAFAILMIALFLTESFLWRQRGIVFFTLFYCLFNWILPKGTEKEKYEKNTHNRGSRLSRVSPM